MSQSTITSYFTSRKRPANDDLNKNRSKIMNLEERRPTSAVNHDSSKNVNKFLSGPSKSHRRGVAKLTFSSDDAHFYQLQPANKVEPSTRDTSSHPKKFTKESALNDLKQKLKNSPRFAELKANAAKLSSNLKKFNQAVNKKELQGFQSIELEIVASPTKNDCKSPNKNLMSPVKNAQLTPKKQSSETDLHSFISPRKVVVSPVKSPTKVPAYIRHASLVTTTTLPLPHHYRLLAELFRAVETASSIFFNRKENITFNKLKPSVQEMVKHNFTMKNLAQIYHLVPEMYKIELQKSKNVQGNNPTTYELFITPVLNNVSKLMMPKTLLERRRKFYENLLNVAKRHHTEFLLTLDPPMTISEEKLTRWHPEFDLEKIPDVPEAAIPQPPDMSKVSSAEDVLSRARQLFSCNTRMERALEKLAQAKARGLSDKEKEITGIGEDQKQTPSTSNVTLINPALRNLPPALLEKVKAKQAAKALEAMTRSSEDEKKAFVVGRLPDLARTLRNIFVTERKNVLSLKVVLSKLDNSFKSNVSAGELENDLRLLSDTLPQWLSFQLVRGCTYLKLDKTENMEAVRLKLEELAKKYNQ